MRVLVSGASGLVGSALVRHLAERGDSVHRLVRPGRPMGEGDVAWDVDAGEIDQSAIEQCHPDAVVHLAGEPIIGRWNTPRRERIRSSRVDGTDLLARSLAALDAEARPSVLVCASATGWYGDRGGDVLTEQSSAGDGFLADVVAAWEAAADPARTAGIRTVHMRTGVVQSIDGGAVDAMRTPFKLGVGGPVGSGNQWLPWVGLTELVSMYAFAIDDERVEGLVNAVGPTPCTAKEHARALGRAWHRPVFLRVPAFAARAAVGEVADELLLVSQKAVPARLEALDYPFIDRDIADAIARDVAVS